MSEQLELELELEPEQEVWIKKIPIINSKGIDQEANILKEIKLQQIASKYGFTPKILGVTKNSSEYMIRMEKINTRCLAESWGDEPSHIPDKFWDQIRCIVKLLFLREGIEYVDITPYNFLEKKDKIYLIDFGHAYFTPDESKITPTNWFLKKFIGCECNPDELNGYNPDFE
jgi:tRNA A-37 threonylcarbamoyl transferase component Bud32